MLQKVVRSTIIDAPIERVWAVLRDFNSHDQWHAVVDQSRIEAGQSSYQVGCVRAFRLKDGNFIREQLLTLDDRDDVAAILAEARQHDFRVRDIVRAVALSDLIRKR